LERAAGGSLLRRQICKLQSFLFFFIIDSSHTKVFVIFVCDIIAIMKILQICSKTPFPPKDGGSLAMNIMTQGLLQCGNEVQVLAIRTPKHPIKDEEIDAQYRQKTKYSSVFIDTNIKAVDAFLNLFSSESYNVSRFYSKDFENELVKILKSQQFDIIHLESIFCAPYLEAIRRHSKSPVVLRSQNIEYRIWERLAANAFSPLKKMYLYMLARRLRKYELAMMNKFDAILPITEADLAGYKELGCTVPMRHVPFGIDVQKYHADNSKTEFPSVFHIGAMDWRPNIEGVEWVLRSIWPRVTAKNKNIMLYLAGRSMPQKMMERKMDQVKFVGEVPDSHEFIRSKSLMLVPLSSGGGMRVKIIEGMALGKTIISTSVGAEGIDYTDQKNIIIADTEEQFEAAIHKCITDKHFSESIGNNARALTEEKYDNKKICEGLSAFYSQLSKK
jgi:glycosyltransferase involved in cell wall biosynthesis